MSEIPNIEKTIQLTARGIIYIDDYGVIMLENDDGTMSLNELISDFNNLDCEIVIVSSDL